MADQPHKQINKTKKYSTGYWQCFAKYAGTPTTSFVFYLLL